MISYWKLGEPMCRIEECQPRCWTRLLTPSGDELRDIRLKYGIPDFFFEDIADTDERARYDSDQGWQLIILRVPYEKDSSSSTPFVTVPFGIVFKDDLLITVCHYKTQMMHDFIEQQCSRSTGIIDTVDFAFRVCYSASVYYLKYLRQINQRIEKAKMDLDTNIDNRSLIALSRLQDSLTYFITSLKGNQSLMAKLSTKLPIDELDSDLIDDVNIELNQAVETAQIYSTILDSTMNTYSSIISNNVNTIMKVLTSVSIILMLPTLIASFLGMNLVNGAESAWWGFPLAIGVSLVVSFAGWVVFKYKNLM